MKNKIITVLLLFTMIFSNTKHVASTNIIHLEGTSEDTITNQIKQKIVISGGSGLYIDETDKNRYIFKGNPNNYMIFNNEKPKKVTKYSLLKKDNNYDYKIYFDSLEECSNYSGELKLDISSNNNDNSGNIKGSRTSNNIKQIDNECIKEDIYEGGWRIVAIEPDGTIKIVRDLSIGEKKWDDNSNTDWKTATLNSYLNNDYYNSIESNSKEKIINYNFNIGNAIPFINHTDISEKEEKWNGHIGLLTPSDFRKSFLKTRCSTEPMSSDKKTNEAKMIQLANDDCYEESYLIKNYDWWLINKNDDSVNYVNGDSVYSDTSSKEIDVQPVLHLNNVELIGNGSPENPYQIKKKIKVKYNIRMSKSFRVPSSDTIETGTKYNSKEAIETEETSCTFEGWYLDENYTIPYVEGTELTEDTELYGKCNCPQIVNVPPTSKFISNYIFIGSIVIMGICIYLYRKVFVKSKIN